MDTTCKSGQECVVTLLAELHIQCTLNFTHSVWGWRVWSNEPITSHNTNRKLHITVTNNETPPPPSASSQYLSSHSLHTLSAGHTHAHAWMRLHYTYVLTHYTQTETQQTHTDSHTNKCTHIPTQGDIPTCSNHAKTI